MDTGIQPFTFDYLSIPLDPNKKKVPLSLSPLAMERLRKVSNWQQKPMPSILRPIVEDWILLDPDFEELLRKATEAEKEKERGTD